MEDILQETKVFTFDLSRQSINGFEGGFYFSLTDVSAELFGEGAFDKGFYFEIPFDLFSNSHSKKKLFHFPTNLLQEMEGKN